MRAILMFVVAVMTPIFIGVKYPVAGHSAGKEYFGISQQEAADLPLAERHSRPKLSLKSALKAAQTFVKKQHSDISSYWLFDARFILYGGNDIPDAEKFPCWAFKWLGDSNGRAIEIVVSMDGEPMERPSL